jgi:hypothetical protein
MGQDHLDLVNQLSSARIVNFADTMYKKLSVPFWLLKGKMNDFVNFQPRLIKADETNRS